MPATDTDTSTDTATDKTGGDSGDASTDKGSGGTSTDTGSDLGEAGKRALDSERNARKEAEKNARDARKEVERLTKEGAEAVERAKAEGKSEAADELLGSSNARLVRAEVIAAAADKMRDPGFYIGLLDLSKFDVRADGTVDKQEIESAIDSLLKDHPELARTSKPGPLPGGGATPSAGSSVDDMIRRKAGRR